MARKYSQFITHNKVGKRHSFDDKPAMVNKYGKKSWYKNDNLHRDNDKPAIVNNGTKSWYKKNNLHRDDKPAIIYSDGTKFWFKKGKFLRGIL